jgi:pimeloyl-ACP methyl ester carboxylesterase
LFRPLIRFIPALFFNMQLMPRFFASWLFGIKRPEDIRFLYSMSRGRRPADFKRLNRLALAFEADGPEGIPVQSIHGTRDHMILARAEPRDVLIEGGGHLISITHADQVNQAILAFIEGESRPLD